MNPGIITVNIPVKQLDRRSISTRGWGSSRIRNFAAPIANAWS